MNSSPSISSNTLRTIKSEPVHDNIDHLQRELDQQKEEYEQQIAQLGENHNEQIRVLCKELEKSSSLLHEYKLEVDAMRLTLNFKDKQLKNKHNDACSDQNLQTKSAELTAENTKLKEDLSILTTKYQALVNEMQDARQYILKMISSLD